MGFNSGFKGLIFILANAVMPIPAAARSKAWLCGCLLLVIVGMNSTGGVDVSVVCQVEVSASGWSFVQRSRTKCDREAPIMKRPWPTSGCGAMVLVQVCPRLVVVRLSVTFQQRPTHMNFIRMTTRWILINTELWCRGNYPTSMVCFYHFNLLALEFYI